LEKAKVTHEASTAGVIVIFGATPLATIVPGEQAFGDIPMTTPEVLGTTKIQEGEPPIVYDVVESPISFERTPSQQDDKPEWEEYLRKDEEEPREEEVGFELDGLFNREKTKEELEIEEE
jgi:hypothetical protein